MKKIIAMSIALGLSAMAQAGTISWVWQGGNTAIDGALATNGYIATHWGGTGPSDLTLLGISVMVDAYAPEYEGLGWYDSLAVVESERGAQYYAATRVFQYMPGVFIGNDEPDFLTNYDIEYKSIDLADVARFWDLIQGTEVMQGEVGGYFTTSPSGIGTAVNGPPNGMWAATLTLSGIPNTPAPVPEPSTYAALAGLAMLVFVMVRRRK